MRYALAILMAAFVIFPSLPSGMAGATGAGDGDGRVEVVVSISDFIPLVKAVGGSFVEVNSILPPGGDPHSFYITQDTVKQIENADVIILADSRLLSYEANIKENYPEKRYLDFDDYNATLDTFPGYGANPHGYWLKFENALAIAGKVRDELSGLRPSDAEYFNSSFSRLEAEVVGAGEDIRRMSEEWGIYGMNVVAAVPGVCYAVQNSGMEVGAVLMAEGSGFASGKEIGDIEDKLKSGEYGGIVVPEFMKEAKAGEIANQIAGDTGAKVAYVKFSMAGSDDSYVNDCYHNAMELSTLAVGADSGDGGTGGIWSGNGYLVPVIISLVLLVILQFLVMLGLYRRDER